MEIMTILVVFALFAVIVSLGWGIGSMAIGGSYDQKHDGQLMNARVAFQAVAIILLLVATVVSTQ